MRKAILVGGAMLLATTGATAAHAGDTQIFAACDGLGKPGKSADGLAGAASTTGLSSFGAASPQGTIAACDAALAHPKLLPTQTLRRARLLRTRAVARAKTGDLVAALTDVDLAGVAIAPIAGDAMTSRSMMVSLDLLRALIYDRMGNSNEALRLARQSAAARPYALEVQEIAAQMLISHNQHDEVAKGVVATANRLDPSFVRLQLGLLGLSGDFKAMAGLAPPVRPVTPPSGATGTDLDVGILGYAFQLRSFATDATSLAYARAATGDVAGARTLLAEVKESMAAFTNRARPEIAGFVKPIEELAALRSAQVEARIAIQEGRRFDAIATIDSKKMPADSISDDLMKALKLNDAASASSAPGLPTPEEGRQAGVRQTMFDGMVEMALIEPENAKTNAIYKKSRPNILGAVVGAAFSMGTTLLADGIQKTDGFTAKQNPDGSVLVSLTGATNSSSVVREMTLLRAAEMAIAAGKPAFVIANRNDYQRVMTSTQYGMEVSRIPTGYKSEMTVRFADSATADARALDAKAIIDALGPFYYKNSA